MPWRDVLGHEEIVTAFRRSVRAGRLASTFLFVGRAGIGKRTFAFELAKALLCEVNPEEMLEACGTCPACQQVAAGTHPDLNTVSKPADRSVIPLEMFIGSDEQRMREGLCRDISLKPFRGGRKIAIIDDADYLNEEGANCLLKTLEEPPPRSIIILISTSEQRQLPTIRSRCQVIRFRPLEPSQVAELLVRQGFVESLDDAKSLSELSQGSVDQALIFHDPEVAEFRTRLLDYLSRVDEDRFAFLKELTAFVNAAGTEAPPRRIRTKLAAFIAAEYYRHLLAALSGYQRTADRLLAESVERGTRNWPAGQEGAAACLERCLQVPAQVDANANLATFVEWWIDDLCQFALSGAAVS